MMQGSHPRTDPGAAVQIVSVRTLPRRERPEADIVLVDEAHELHREFFRWMDDRPDLPFVGLLATPWSRGLGKHYDDLIVASTTNDLIAQGYLSPFVVFAPSEPDLASVRTIAGDFHEGELADAVDKPKLVGDVVETWLSRGENRPTLCYGVNRGHAEHLQQRFLEAGVAAAYIDAFVERQERERIFDRFRAGEIRVICNIATLAVGLDLPMCSCIVDAKPTKSEIRFVQTIGRGLRTAPGKDRRLVLDNAGNSLRLGVVTDIHHTHLDDGKARKSGTESKERSERLPRLCDECKAVLPATAKVCPKCGQFASRKQASRIVMAIWSNWAPGRAASVRQRFSIWPNSSPNCEATRSVRAMPKAGPPTNSRRNLASGRRSGEKCCRSGPDDAELDSLASNCLRQAAEVRRWACWPQTSPSMPRAALPRFR